MGELSCQHSSVCTHISLLVRMLLAKLPLQLVLMTIVKAFLVMFRAHEERPEPWFQISIDSDVYQQYYIGFLGTRYD